ncbi:MAG: DNA polymerase III subunit beta [Clostridia bacterium]|nr:DNA polymerase III subunit beta [Clostridia bacterium]MBR4439404.1 DNA polymerase III subunit beta [Clostridia bacterium]MBR5769697.1 DNA polymerase III subunit beta [Clostridia bacterium]MBR5942158.1 DNA polymerase III subunit beta [Clostridia bacterium]
MKFTVEKDQFARAVNNVLRAVPVKPQNQNLEGVLLRADKKFVRMTGYDSIFGINTSVEADVESEGEIVLNAKLFAEIVRKMPEGYLTVSVEGSTLVTIANGDTVFDIVGASAEMYPELPYVEHRDELVISQKVFRDMIEKSSFAVATTDINPILTGSLLECRDNTLSVVSVDSAKLAVVKEKCEYKGEKSFIVPGKSLAEIAKILSDDDDAEVCIYSSGKEALFIIDNYEMVTKLIMGKFIDYKKSLPSEHRLEIIAERSALYDAVDRASLLITDRFKAPVRCVFRDDRIRLSCTTEMGKIAQEIPARITGDGFEAGYNNKFLYDALRAADCEHIKLQLNSPLSPMMLSSAEGNNFMYLIMPVRLAD